MVLGIHVERLFEGGNRLGRPALVHEHRAQVVTVQGAARIEPHGRLQASDRLAQAAERLKGDPQVTLCRREIGPQDYGALQDTEGIGKPPSHPQRIAEVAQGVDVIGIDN